MPERERPLQANGRTAGVVELAAPADLGQRTGVIFRKEFKEIFRDRRTLFTVIVSPLLVTPAMFALLGMLITGQTEKARTETYTVGVTAPADAATVVGMLRLMPRLKLVEVTAEEAQREIKDRKLSAAVVFPSGTEEAVAAGQTLPVQVLEDAGDQGSQSAAGRLDAAIGEIGQRIVARRLASHALPADFARPFAATDVPIKHGGSAATFLLSMMLPYVLAVSAFSGATFAAFDQVAGEKERGTLETLLVSPASRRDIVLGKFSAVVAVCLISSVLSVLGLVISFSLPARAFSWLSRGGLHLSVAAVVVTLLVMLPLAVLFAGLLLGVSTFARNQKEAQSYLAPLLMMVLMPAMSSMFVSADAGLSVALVPVLNAALIIKQALSGTYSAAFIVVATAASILYAALALSVATHLFGRESVLLKT